MTYTVDELKAGVVAMSTRPFGERFAERLLQIRYKLERGTGHHDLTDSTGSKIESKFSRIFAEVPGERPLDFIVNSSRKRLGRLEAPFTANFQKIHPSKFDVLYYGIVSDEGVLIHKAMRDEVRFDNQHLNNEEMKQFSIDRGTLEDHDRFRIDILDWSTILGYLKEAM